MMHTLWNFQLLLVSPSIRSNRDHFLQADYTGVDDSKAIRSTAKDQEIFTQSSVPLLSGRFTEIKPFAESRMNSRKSGSELSFTT